MSRGVNARGGRKGRRRGRVWVIGAVAVVFALLYWEQTALLYVLSTLAMCCLLLVVAFSHLEGTDKELAETTRQEKTAPSDAGEVTAATGPRPKRRAARRRRHEAA